MAACHPQAIRLMSQTLFMNRWNVTTRKAPQIESGKAFKRKCLTLLKPCNMYNNMYNGVCNSLHFLVGVFFHSFCQFGWILRRACEWRVFSIYSTEIERPKWDSSPPTHGHESRHVTFGLFHSSTSWIPTKMWYDCWSFSGSIRFYNSARLSSGSWVSWSRPPADLGREARYALCWSSAKRQLTKLE